MNTYTKSQFIIFFFLTIIYACELQSKDNDVNKKMIKDLIFIVTNIENLDLIDSLNWDFENLYFDTLKNQKFEKLSTKLKLKYLKGLLKYSDGVTLIPDDWIEKDLQAFIIGTRPKIGSFQPKIIKIYGTDYTAAVLVNLDDKANVVSVP